MRVLLRCDSTKSQGLGHVVRCVSVGEAAREAGWDVVAAGDIESPLGRRLLEGVADELLPRPADAAALARLARQQGADVVHLDTYDDEGDVRAQLAESGILLSSMEDGSFGRRPADLAVDPSAGAEFDCRPDDGTLRLARGADFIPVRALVRELRAEPPGVQQSRAASAGGLAVVIVMGGTDARNATAAAIRMWAEAGVASHCTAIVPAGQSPETGELPRGLSLESVEQSSDLPRLFAEADLVISGAGTTIWELAALGVPMAIIQLVENQGQNYDFAVERGMAAGLGAFGQHLEGSVETLRQALSDSRLRAELADTARSIVDGGGASRIVGLWEDLAANRSGGIAVRPATLSDAAQLFYWRNHPSVRAVSRSTGELQWDGHVAWLERALQRSDVVLLLAEADGLAAGTVRFDAHGDRDWEVSITLAPAARGRGIARTVLRAAEDRFRREHPEATLHAVMRTSNEPSYRLFVGAGYEGGVEQSEATDDDGWYRLVKAPARRP
ncbi:bifunctional UDP-2,4-diacetamido-2,4,6-trideoxy-beta-L-altropyranose hydrolase/GNAT family N-acetyltransferase [Sinomonas terrae]|uniref:Bifunctional UDP-2,4-diacetamido-2,4,6-trideoxy-beta-L-altropyranose hydrolase/GNAT family N-acetyltransferase n=1 Tax=Sinomonas terrae TaxID=2908838 RepID=A0ABS9TZ00_9MICC|nr:bifunctional UDP-2,4-diacetamido-2,4,6-trideoxy-beta-L-altropyranose hydrolase/GNAT family N-acetyltransferase [Sinomonas terrae]MCH6469664.1 bifunctional UDP-2,4-diacetamido-2,4,6-trideoxy-beta-L-altropyranose hydrolase/GNAT family N-acetyltransferase [Sinomonas terrae]